MKLSRKETDHLLLKLREKYDSYSFEFSEKYFNREEFEKRLLYAQQNRMDIAAFLLAEVANFEKLKDSFDRKKEKSSFSEKIDRVIEEQLERLQKYPKIEFHPRAGIEESHMYGALTLFADEIFPVMWILSDDFQIRTAIGELDDSLGTFVSMSRERLAPKTEDHALLLSRPGVREVEAEKSKNNYLKEAAFYFHKIIDFCDTLVEKRVEGLDMPLQFSRSHESSARKKALAKQFSNLTGFGALMKIREYCEGVISDFRLSAFRTQ